MGLEIPQAVINDTTFRNSFTNEGGVENTIRLLKNIMGLWLVQECRRQWAEAGDQFSFSQLAQMAAEAKPFTAYVDPDDGRFLAPRRYAPPPSINTCNQQARPLLKTKAK